MWSALALAPEVYGASGASIENEELHSVPLHPTSPDQTVHGGCVFAHLRNVQQHAQPRHRGQKQRASASSATAARPKARVSTDCWQLLATRSTTLLPIPEEGHVRTHTPQPWVTCTPLPDRGLQITPEIASKHHMLERFAAPASACVTHRPTPTRACAPPSPLPSSQIVA